jgi:hypothetical protein
VSTEIYPTELAAPRRAGFPTKRLIALLLLLLLFVAPSLWWRVTPLREHRVLIVDKTLPRPEWREHERVTWWLTHRRVTSPRGDSLWDATRDYLGYDPTAKRGTDLSDAALDSVNLVYIADAYGVYAGDYLVDDDTSTHAELEPSQRIYGGMTSDEVEALTRYVARGGSVVAEFNTLEEPTSGTAAGEALGALLGVRYQRWLGRWYANLESSDEIPQWMRERYERVYWKPWDFSGAGIVIFSETEDRIVVVSASEFTADWPITLEVEDTDDPLVRGVRSGQPYWYWVTGTEPTDSGSVLAWYDFHVTGEAKRRLERSGFAARFPAIVRHKGSGMRAYFAGDFADVGVRPPPLMRTRGLDWLGRYQDREKKPGMQGRFFWGVTLPLWDAMLSESEASANLRR